MNKNSKSWATDKSSGAYLFSFPFPIYINTEARFFPIELKVKTETIRIYPFFRSGPANFGSSPAIDSAQIPLSSDNYNPIKPSTPNYLPLLKVVPLLVGDPAGSAIATLSPVWGKTPHFFPMDSMRIDILGSHLKPKNFASNLIHHFLRYIRVLTRQWWIGLEYPNGNDYYLQQIIPISRSGIFKGVPEQYKLFITPRGDELPLDETIWNKVIFNIRCNILIADYEDLLLDARYHFAKNEMRRVIIDLAVACEQACETTFIRIIEKKEQKKIGVFKRGRYYSGNDLTKHLNKDLKKLSGFSLDADMPKLSNQISELWSLRGDLAHGRHQDLPKEKVSLLIEAAEECVRWLENLTTDKA